MKKEKLRIINQIFSPSAPVIDLQMFEGRGKQISLIKSALDEVGKHIVLYGKRGVGKTSVSNILNQIFTDYYVAKVTCNRTDNFMSVWEKAVSKVQYVEPIPEIGFEKKEKTALLPMYLPDKEFIDAGDIENVFADIQTPILLIFDEFDTIQNDEVKIMMADTLKVLSDNNKFVKIMIVGIAENINDLIGYHPSLERCISQIFLPLMSKEEIKILIENRLGILEMKMSNSVKDKIADYSSGFAHYIHLLCKYAATAAVKEKSNLINKKYFDISVKQSIEESDYSIKSSFEKAVKSSRKKNQFEDIIYACAISRTDNEDSYTPGFVLNKFNKIRNKEYPVEAIRYNLGMLCRPERGNVLEKTGTSRRKKYRFSNPLMKAFVKLKMHEKK